MQQDEKKEKGTPVQVKSASEGTPLSQTIANAHAAGDGALERDKDTLMSTKDSEEAAEQKQREAY